MYIHVRYMYVISTPYASLASKPTHPSRSHNVLFANKRLLHLHHFRLILLQVINRLWDGCYVNTVLEKDRNAKDDYIPSQRSSHSCDPQLQKWQPKQLCLLYTYTHAIVTNQTQYTCHCSPRFFIARGWTPFPSKLVIVGVAKC